MDTNEEAKKALRAASKYEKAVLFKQSLMRIKLFTEDVLNIFRLYFI